MDSECMSLYLLGAGAFGVTSLAGRTCVRVGAPWATKTKAASVIYSTALVVIRCTLLGIGMVSRRGLPLT